MRAIEIEQENAEQEVLEYLVESCELSGPALGIAKQVRDKGRDSLTEKQEYVFQRFVADKYFRMTCGACQVPMPSNEVIGALEDGGLCARCAHMKAKYF